MEFLFAAVIGVAIGVVVGLLGAGGGILSVPVLVYILGQSPHDATSGSLVIVLLSAITGLWAHARNGNVRWKEGFTVGLFSSVAAVIGARIVPHIQGDVLMILFAILVTGVGIYMLWRGIQQRRVEFGKAPAPVEAKEGEEKSPALWAIALAGSLVGLASGIFGIGGGFAVVPILIYMFHFTNRQATGTSILVMSISSAAGLLGRIGTPVSIDWPIVLLFAAGSMLGSLLGEPIGRRLRPSTLTLAFGSFLIIVAALTVAQTVL